MSWLRLATIAFLTLTYAWTFDRSMAIHALALSLLALGWMYAGVLVAAKPYRRFRILMTSYVTVAGDAAFATLWIWATGGFNSPYYPIFIIAVVGVAYRFGPRETAGAALAYAASYAFLLAVLGQLLPNLLDASVRLGFVVLAAAVSAWLAHDSSQQVIAKQAMKQRLHESQVAEAKFRGLLEAAPDPIVIVDSRGRIAIVNTQAEAAFGYGRQELYGCPLQLLLPGHDPGRAKSARARPRARLGDQAQFGVRRDGSRFAADVSLSPIETEEGTFVGTIIRDVTQQRRAQDALVESEQRFRALAKATSEAVAIHHQGFIVDANERFTTLFGFPSEQDAVGRHLVDLADGPQASKMVHDLVHGSNSVSEWTGTRPDGSTFSAQSQTRPIQYRGRAAQVTVIRDVTSARTAEAERLRAVRQRAEIERLNSINQFKSQFLNTAAHELNTPLTPIKVQLFLLERALKDDNVETLGRGLDLLGRNFDRLERLVQDLLQAGRLDSGRLELKQAPCDLTAILREALETFEVPAQAKKLRLSLDAPEQLPLVADASRLTQVVYNLVSNAIKYSRPGGRVHMSATCDDERIRLCVRDTGLGLTPQQAMKLFQPFSQAHADQHPAIGGTGLGLFIARGIVNLHGGRVWCTSPGPNQGSQFFVELPRNGAGANPRSNAQDQVVDEGATEVAEVLGA